VYIEKIHAGVECRQAMKKIVIVGEHLVDHCWTVACDQHLYDPVYLTAHEHRPSHATNKPRRATHQ